MQRRRLHNEVHKHAHAIFDCPKVGRAALTVSLIATSESGSPGDEQCGSTSTMEAGGDARIKRVAGTSQSGISVLMFAGLAKSILFSAWTCQRARQPMSYHLIDPVQESRTPRLGTDKTMVGLGSSRLLSSRQRVQRLCSSEPRAKLDSL